MADVGIFRQMRCALLCLMSFGVEAGWLVSFRAWTQVDSSGLFVMWKASQLMVL